MNKQQRAKSALDEMENGRLDGTRHWDIIMEALDTMAGDTPKYTITPVGDTLIDSYADGDVVTITRYAVPEGYVLVPKDILDDLVCTHVNRELRGFGKKAERMNQYEWQKQYEKEENEIMVRIAAPPYTIDRKEQP